MEHGFVLVNNVPYVDPNTTKEVLERIAFIRETHYGGFYDFKPDLAMADTAYTNLALDPHTDTTYFTEPAGLQAFHLLSHEPAAGEELAEGGETILVDGFNAAQILREQDPRAYQVLSAYKLPWHASGNEGINIGPDQLYPVFQHNDGKLHRIRWNKDDRGVLPFDEQYTTQDWYEAASKFDQIVSSPDSQYVFQLKPGTVLSEYLPHSLLLCVLLNRGLLTATQSLTIGVSSTPELLSGVSGGCAEDTVSAAAFGRHST